jgi:hypothetical protein
MIRCQQTEDLCPGTTDFKVAKEGKLAFAESGPVEVVGLFLVAVVQEKELLDEQK